MSYLQPILDMLPSDSLVALDLETTGLDPRRGRIRLLSLAVPGRQPFVIDAFTVDISPLLPALEHCTIIGHNLQFDFSFLWQLGFRPGEVWDTMLASQLLRAGSYKENNLKVAVEAFLGQEVA